MSLGSNVSNGVKPLNTGKPSFTNIIEIPGPKGVLVLAWLSIVSSGQAQSTSAPDPITENTKTTICIVSTIFVFKVLIQDVE